LFCAGLDKHLYASFRCCFCRCVGGVLCVSVCVLSVGVHCADECFSLPLFCVCGCVCVCVCVCCALINASSGRAVKLCVCLSVCVCVSSPLCVCVCVCLCVSVCVCLFLCVRWEEHMSALQSP